MLMKERLPKIYSKELVEYLYYEFYTKNEYLRNEFNISRSTANKYLKLLEEQVLSSVRKWVKKLYTKMLHYLI